LELADILENQLQAQDTETFIGSLRQKQQEEYEKALSTKSQTVKKKSPFRNPQDFSSTQVLWQNALESRIRMQKVLSDGNRLPLPNTLPRFCGQEPTIPSAIKDLSQTFLSLLTTLVELKLVF
jgi:hypothetical protein